MSEPTPTQSQSSILDTPTAMTNLPPVERMAADILAQRHSPGYREHQHSWAWHRIEDASPRIRSMILRDIRALAKAGLLIDGLPEYMPCSESTRPSSGPNAS